MAAALDRTRHARRRLLQGGLAFAGLGLLSGCARLPLQTRGAERVPRVGYLSATPVGVQEDAFRRRLREHGYVEGRTIAIEYSITDGHSDRLPDAAAALVASGVDIIVARGTAAALAAKHATGTVPIVMAGSGDPIRSGLVESLARPGGNVTGLSSFAPELNVKRLELLREAVPSAARVAILVNSTNPNMDPSQPAMARYFDEIGRAGRGLGFELQLLDVRGADDLERAFAAAGSGRAEALGVPIDPLFLQEAARITSLAARARLPAIYDGQEFIDAGGLMSYHASLDDEAHRAADLVDRILKGAKPADLPIERPTKFELVINLRTAQALGLTIPPSVLQQATQVIQ